MSSDRSEIVKACFRAYETGDPGALHDHLAEDLLFFSPPDPGLDRAQYFERCWPNHGRTRAFEFVRLVEAGDEILVTYEATRADGTRFRNTEVFTFAGDRIRRIEVYFGWDL
jgi:ketosteroid isomerase-like protein